MQGGTLYGNGGVDLQCVYKNYSFMYSMTPDKKAAKKALFQIGF